MRGFDIVENKIGNEVMMGVIRNNMPLQIVERMYVIDGEEMRDTSIVFSSNTTNGC